MNVVLNLSQALVITRHFVAQLLSENALETSIYVDGLFSTEWEQGDPADYCTGEHFYQGGPCQKSQLQGQNGPTQQEEQKKGRTGQVHEGRMKSYIAAAAAAIL